MRYAARAFFWDIHDLFHRFNLRGGVAGALLRWFLAGRFNPFHPFLPPGTLAANLIGGYLIGVAVALFAALPDVSPQWRLFVVTGFLGGLTTFSTFSAEVVSQLHQGRPGWALAIAALHLANI